MLSPTANYRLVVTALSKRDRTEEEKGATSSFPQVNALIFSLVYRWYINITTSFLLSKKKFCKGSDYSKYTV